MNDNDPYRRSAEVVFHDLKEGQRVARTAQAEYGKWLINTLWLMHSGSIVGLLFKAHAGQSPPPYFSALWWFVAGIVLAFGAGFSAWWNFTFAAAQYEKWADHRMLNDQKYWPKETGSSRSSITLWIAVAFGVLSVGCLLGGAWAVSSSWH